MDEIEITDGVEEEKKEPDQNQNENEVDDASKHHKLSSQQEVLQVTGSTIELTSPIQS